MKTGAMSIPEENTAETNNGGKSVKDREAAANAMAAVMEALDHVRIKVEVTSGQLDFNNNAELSEHKLDFAKAFVKTTAPFVCQLAIKENRTAEEEELLAFDFERVYGSDMGRLHNDTLSRYARQLDIAFPRHTEDQIKVERDQNKEFAEQLFEMWTPDQMAILTFGIEKKIKEQQDKLKAELINRLYLGIFAQAKAKNAEEAAAAAAAKAAETAEAEDASTCETSSVSDTILTPQSD